MAEPVELPAGLVVVGANHRSSSVMLRDQLFVDDRAAPEFLAALRRAGIRQGLVLSTCDRVEVQAIHGCLAEATAAVRGALAARAGLDPGELDGQIYSLEGEAALHHVFAVAASLDSQIVGEPQVLGQVKASHRLARTAGASGPELETVMQAAYAAAKRVRSETTIAERPVSVAAAAVQVARDVHGELTERTALLVGGADMGELMAEQLLAAGLGRLLVTAPRLARAEAVAQRFACNVVAFDGFAAELANVDIVLASLGARHYLIGSEMVEAALARRRRRPMFLIDAAVPGDIAPEVDRVDDAFLYDLEDLEQVAMLGRATRQAAAGSAWEIIATEVADFLRGRAERRAVPAVAELREQFEAARRRALDEAEGDAERATRLLVNRLLHAPSEALREIAGGAAEGERERAERLLRRLFRLGEENEK